MSTFSTAMEGGGEGDDNAGSGNGSNKIIAKGSIQAAAPLSAYHRRRPIFSSSFGDRDR
jgi:hypothetical protein